MGLTDPRRGQIWQVNLEPTIGSEIRKARPCVVISSDTFSRIPVRLVVPLTEWKDAKHQGRAWVVRVEPTRWNGLDKVDAADPLQARCISVDAQRFLKFIGQLDADLVDEIASAFKIVTEAA